MRSFGPYWTIGSVSPCISLQWDFINLYIIVGDVSMSIFVRWYPLKGLRKEENDPFHLVNEGHFRVSAVSYGPLTDTIRYFWPQNRASRVRKHIHSTRKQSIVTWQSAQCRAERIDEVVLVLVLYGCRAVHKHLEGAIFCISTMESFFMQSETRLQYVWLHCYSWQVGQTPQHDQIQHMECSRNTHCLSLDNFLPGFGHVYNTYLY